MFGCCCCKDHRRVKRIEKMTEHILALAVAQAEGNAAEIAALTTKLKGGTKTLQDAVDSASPPPPPPGPVAP